MMNSGFISIQLFAKVAMAICCQTLGFRCQVSEFMNAFNV